jgi:hypothetical protein
MSAAAKTASGIGFLTVVEHAEFGFFGGYLILNAAGRPLEFHCTAPVKPSRAQEILYGPTLRHYLYEQMAAALLAKGKTVPHLLCTDLPAMLAARPPEQAMVLVPDADETDTSAALVRISLGGQRVALPAADAHLQAAIEAHWREASAEQIDLREPFGRIREALEEAQKAARAAA